MQPKSDDLTNVDGVDLKVLDDAALVRLALRTETNYQRQLAECKDEAVGLVKPSNVLNHVRVSCAPGLVDFLNRLGLELMRRRLWSVLSHCQLDEIKARAFLSVEQEKSLVETISARP